MDSIRIRGGRPLEGEIEIFGAKNAALPLMAASLLTDETLTLSNLPRLVDIATLSRLLARHGVHIEREDGEEGGVMALTAAKIVSTQAPYELVRQMRASILVLGPLLARTGRAEVSLPGGCAIGSRPVDIHIEGLKRLGAEIALQDGYIRAEAEGPLRGGRISLPFASVGATENLMMAATLADGETLLQGAAREPEVVDLARCLKAMGADISGAGSSEIVIRGKRTLTGARHRTIADRIETGTYALAVAIAGGEVELVGAPCTLLGALFDYLRLAGARICETQRGVRIGSNGTRTAANLTTQPYPGFPTDLQAQAMALMTVAEGEAAITETIFENRFTHVPELCRMGAEITVDGNTALVRGVSHLTGAPVMATDLRASSSLVLAGLAAKGQTVVNRVYHLDRGYERIENKLAACGADIRRVRA